MRYIARYDDGLVHAHEGDDPRPLCGAEVHRLDGGDDDQLEAFCSQCYGDIEGVLGLRPGELAKMTQTA